MSHEPDELLDPYGPYFYLNAPPGYYGSNAQLVELYLRRTVHLTAVEQAKQKRAERKAAVDQYLERRRRERNRADQ